MLFSLFSTVFALFLRRCCFLATVVTFFLSVFSGDCWHFYVFMPDAVHDVRMPPPFLISEYIVNNPNHVDARRFTAIRDASALEELPDRNWFRRLTTSGW